MIAHIPFAQRCAVSVVVVFLLAIAPIPGWLSFVIGAGAGYLIWDRRFDG